MLVNGYYFSISGNEYCDSDNLDLSAPVEELEADITN